MRRRLPEWIITSLPCAALLLDHALAALSLAACIRGVVALRSPTRFVMYYAVQEMQGGGEMVWRNVRAEGFYTLATFFQSFHVRKSSCLR